MFFQDESVTQSSEDGYINNYCITERTIAENVCSLALLKIFLYLLEVMTYTMIVCYMLKFNVYCLKGLTAVYDKEETGFHRKKKRESIILT